MTDHEKNFRSQYYDKVGFRAVEEKRSIDGLFEEQPMKKEKLIQFSLQNGLPDMFRLYVWKILLGVLPVTQSSQDFVWFHRQEQVKELERAAILLHSDTIDGPQELKMLVMKLIEEGNLPMQKKGLAQEKENQYFMAIVRTISSLVASETDLFWISTRLFRHINTLGSFEKFPEYTMQCLMKEDKSQKLYQHLSKHNIETALPLREWFGQCFACILPETSVERIWDRVICGSSHILVFVAVAIFIVLRRPLLAMQKTKDIVAYLNQIPDDCGDRIVNEALNLFQDNDRVWTEREDSPVVNGSGSENSRTSSRSLTDSGRHSAKSFTDSGRHATVTTPTGRSTHILTSQTSREKAMSDTVVTVTLGSGSMPPQNTSRKSPSFGGRTS